MYSETIKMNPSFSPIFAAHFFPFLGIYALLIIVFYINGLYEIRSFAPSSSVIAKLVISHTLGFVFGIVIFYFSSDPQITPKINLALNIAISFSLVSAWRIVFQRFIAQHLKTNVAIAVLAIIRMGIDRRIMEIYADTFSFKTIH